MAICSSADCESRRSKSKNNIRNSAYVLLNLVSKDFKLKYRRSVLGVLWSVLNPLLMMIVMVLIFTNIFRWTFDQYSFPVYVVLGQVLFSVFQDGTNDALGSIVYNSSLIKKVYIEKIIFPTEKCVFALVNFCFSLIAVAIVMLICGMVPSWKVILVPALLFLLLFFVLGISYIVSALSVFFHDVMHLWGVLTTVMFYFTPIFWPYAALMDNGVGFVYQIIQFNPMFHFVSCFRQMVTGISIPGDIAILPQLGLCAVFSVVTFLIGVLIFKKSEKKFILYV